jgi:hypothetical protein
MTPGSNAHPYARRAWRWIDPRARPPPSIPRRRHRARCAQISRARSAASSMQGDMARHLRILQEVDGDDVMDLAPVTLATEQGVPECCTSTGTTRERSVATAMVRDPLPGSGRVVRYQHPVRAEERHAVDLGTSVFGVSTASGRPSTTGHAPASTATRSATKAAWFRSCSTTMTARPRAARPRSRASAAAAWRASRLAVGPSSSSAAGTGASNFESGGAPYALSDRVSAGATLFA